MRIYVGNLSYDTHEDDLRDAFAQFGAVESCTILTDRETGRSRGFGFVEMANNDEAQAAIRELDGQMFDGRNLRVNEARPRNERGGGGRRY